MLCASAYASAYDFVSEGIAYTITSFADLECGVSSADVLYEGDITIPEEVSYKGKSLTVVSIGDYAFENSAVTSVIFPKSLCKIGKYSFRECKLLRSINIPKIVKHIGEGCFWGCTSIETIVLPNTLTWLGSSAFKECTNLRKVTLSGLSELKAYTFAGCVNLNSVTWEDNNLLRICDQAFANCGLESFQIPNSVTSIGDSILSGNKKLQSFTIGNGLNRIQSDPIKNCPNVKDLIIADGDKSLQLDYSSGDLFDDKGAYTDANLENIYIGRVINYNTRDHLSPFCHNKNIKKVEIGPNILSIDSYAFEDCSSLETVILGAKMSSIGWDAFDGCNSITSIYCKAKTPPTCYTYFPRELYLNCNLYIPPETEDVYKQESPWNNFWNICEETGIANIYGDIKIWLKDNSLYISGKKESQIVEIYNTQGQLVEYTTASIIEMRSKGTFIVKIGSWAQKIML